jgi:hypothetical protein
LLGRRGILQKVGKDRMFAALPAISSGKGAEAFATVAADAEGAALATNSAVAAETRVIEKMSARHFIRVKVIG